MAVYRIIEMGDTVLRQKCQPVKHITPNIHKLLTNMAETMYDANGVGLAAPQVGVPKQIIVVDVGDGLIELINPEIVSREGVETDYEGCLSIPGIRGEVPRAVRVTVRGFDRTGQKVEFTGEGLLARAFQHEIDHLEGILFIDRAESVEKI